MSRSRLTGPRARLRESADTPSVPAAEPTGAAPSLEAKSIIRILPITAERLEATTELDIEFDDWTGQSEAYEQHIRLHRWTPVRQHAKAATSSSKDKSLSFPVTKPDSSSTQANQVRAHHSAALSSPIDGWFDAQEVAVEAVPPAASSRAPRSAASNDDRAASSELELGVLPLHATAKDFNAEPLTVISETQSGPWNPIASPKATPAAPAERTVPVSPLLASPMITNLAPDSNGSVAQGAASASKAAEDSFSNVRPPSDRWIDLQERDWAREPPPRARPPIPPQASVRTLPSQKDNGKRRVVSEHELSSDDSGDGDAHARRRRAEETQPRFKGSLIKKREEAGRKNTPVQAKQKETRGRGEQKKQKIQSQAGSSSLASKKLKKRRGGEVEDLSSNINADAFARSTAPSIRKDFAEKLKKLRQARRGIVKDSEADGSDSQLDEAESIASSSSGRSSCSDSSSGSSAFIVDDDEVEHESGKVTRSVHPPLGRRRSPPSLNSVLPRRLELAEAANVYVEWLVYKILSATSKLPISRQEEYLRARRHLQQHLKDSQRFLSSSAMRRQFSWYLKQYPNLTRRMLFSAEIQEHRGCAACHRSKQKCDSELSFGGRPYSQETLEWLDEEEDEQLSSEMSSNAEDLAEHRSAKDPRRTFDRRGTQRGRLHVFFAGSFCAHRAVLLHALTHWEVQTLGRVYKSADCKALMAKHDDGKVVTEREVDHVVRQHSDRVKRDLLSLRSQATEIARK